MKKVFVSICMAVVVVAMTSCRTSKEITSLASLNGEWDIVEINGTVVASTQTGNVPSLGFDTTTGRVYGNSGCNRLTGSFDINAKLGTLDLGRLGSTRMMCPDMTVEQNVLNALGQVKGYKKMGKSVMALCNAANRPVLLLKKIDNREKLSMLKGEWMIAEVKEEAIPEGMESQPFIAFDLKEKRIHGNAGCNLINGAFVTDEANALSISIPGMAVTMMACPNMDIEDKVLRALNEVKSFDLLSGGGIGLYGADNTLVLVLKKK